MELDFNLPPLKEQPDVLLVQPPLEYGPCLTGTGESHGLELLATVLRQSGYTVKVLDTFLLNMYHDQIIAAMKHYRPKMLLGFSIQIMDMFLRVKELLDNLPDDFKQVITVVGGHAPTFWYKQILEDCPDIDVVVRVEGEGAILELMQFVERSKTLNEIDGIVYRSNDGHIIQTAPRRLLSDLSALPRVHRDTLSFGMKKMELTPTLQTSRGCVGSCSFCSLHSFYNQHRGPKIRFRPVADILDEINDLYNNFGVRYFRFEDDTLFFRSEDSRQRAIQIAQGILERKLNLHFVIQLRADAVDKAVLMKLKAAGLVLVMVGIEAFDEETLALYGKRTTIEDNYRAAQILSELNIRFRACYITFNPYTKIKQLRNSIQFFRSLTGPHQCDHIFNRLWILLGTPIERKLNMAGLLRPVGYEFDYDFQDPMVAEIWKYCELYLPIFTPVKREIGALWQWWFQHSSEACTQFEIDLERCEHDLSDHHLYFLENLVDWVEEKQSVDINQLICTMRERVEAIDQRLKKLKNNEIERGVNIRLYLNYVFDPNDLTYGLEDDLRGRQFSRRLSLEDK